MAELAAETKDLDFRLEQVQDFTPTPMTVSTETWYSGFHPYTLEPVFSAKTPEEKQRQRLFFFWYKPEERARIMTELRRLNRPDLIQRLFGTNVGFRPQSERAPQRPQQRENAFQRERPQRERPQRERQQREHPRHERQQRPPRNEKHRHGR